MVRDREIWKQLGCNIIERGHHSKKRLVIKHVIVPDNIKTNTQMAYCSTTEATIYLLLLDGHHDRLEILGRVLMAKLCL